MCWGWCWWCENMVLKYLWFDCETAIAWDYVIRVTKDNCWCSASLVLMPDVPTWPDAVTSLTSVLSSWTCGNPVLSWTWSALASSYDIYEWATLITNTTLTTYTISWASAWSHTYTVYAKNAVWISQWVNTIIVVVTCATAPNPVTNVSVTDAWGGAYDCGDPIITWTASTTPWALYTVKEWAATIASWLSTTSYTISWATIWNHTYTVEAYNWVWSSAWVSVSVNVVACLSAPWNVTGTINVYDSGTMVNYTCGTWFDVDFTDVATATYYQLFEWATQIGSNSSTSNFVVTGQSVGSHTYTIYACNWAWCSTGTNFTVNVVACWPYTITWGGCNRFLAYGAANTFWCNIVAEALIIQESTSWVIGTKDVTIVYDFTSIDSGAYTIITLRKYDWWATELWDGTTSSWSTSSWTEFYIWNITDPAGTNYTWTVTFTNVDFSAWYTTVIVDHWVVFPWKNITYNSYTMTVS